MKNLTKISIITLLTLFISNCGENLIEEVKERYSGGELKVVEYYKKIGDTQKLVRKREYHNNGQIKMETNYKDEKLEGKWIWYYENGQIEGEGNFKDGKLDGKWTFYYENGQIEFEYNYKDGKEDGKWTYYYENGQIEWERNYKDGKPIE